MTVFIGADHRGYEMKNALIDYLHDKNIRVEDLGNYNYERGDDYPDYAHKVATAVLQHPQEYLGIVICGSGIGVSVAANRYKGIRCALAFTVDQVKHGRERDQANIIALPADYITLDQAKQLVDTFLDTQPLQEERDIRRIAKIEVTQR